MQVRWLSRRLAAAAVTLVIAGPALTLAGAGRAPQDKRTAPEPRPADAAALEDFGKRVKEYVEIQKTLEGKLTNRPDEASPEAIDKHERALAALIENARRTARPGDIFTPPVQAIVRRELARIFGGADGRQLLSSIMDENPAKATLKVNGRYPDVIPMSTMPPEVLAVLPPLPKELNYRFVADQLILLDTVAHIVVDYVPKALPPSP